MSTITDKHFKIIRVRDNADSHLRLTKSNDQRKRDHKREQEERVDWDISNPGKSINNGMYLLKPFLSYVL